MISFGTQKAPAPSIVLPFYGTAAIAFLVLSILMLLSAVDFTGHFFQPHLLAITHIATLGWATMIIFGASHQLLPVVIEVTLFSEKLAKLCYGFLLAGVLLLVVTFWTFRVGWIMELGATLILTATILYAINVHKTADKNENWTITSDCMVTASWWLVLTALLGVLLVFNLQYAFFPKDHLFYLKMHAHMGMAGWLLMMIMGVGSRLLPMFLLSKKEPGFFVKISYWCVNTALVAFLVMGFFFNTLAYWPILAGLVFIAILSYYVFVRKTWKEAMRTKKVDWPMKTTMMAVGFMVIPFIFLAILAFKQEGDPMSVPLSVAYGMSVLGGFITAIILGQTFKTLPFIIWMNRYKKLVGKMKIPLPKDLYNEKLATYQLIFYVIGIFSAILGVAYQKLALIIVGSAGLVVTAIFYNINVYILISHKVKRIKKEEPKNVGIRRRTESHGSVRISQS